MAVERVYVGRGLDGLDDKIDLLESYFREMQKTSVETAYGPEDFLSFAGCAHYFGVIMIETLPPESNQDDGTDEDAEGELEEETQPVSRATSPPSSIAPSPSNLGSPYIIADSSESMGGDSLVGTAYTSPRTHSEQERDQKWEKCYQVDIQEMGFFRPEEDPNAPFFRKKEMPHRASTSLISDHPHASSASMTSDDCVNWPESDEEGSTPPIIQEGSSKFYSAMNHPFRPPLADLNFGGQHMASLQSDAPSFMSGETISPIDKADPNLEVPMHDAAIRLRGELRSNRVRAHETAPKTTPIGLIYLSASQNFLDPLHMGECSMGLYIDPAFRQKGAIINAINDVTEVAFNNHECHRLQSIVVDNEDKLPILELLASAGFHNEGVHRHAFYSNATREWKDVTYFSMLATDWVYDNNNKNPQVRLRPKSLWDDLLSRHQRECDDLVRLEEKHGNKLKRVASTETVRDSLTGRGDTAATSGKFIPGYSQQALQKKRRIDSGQEARESSSSASSSIFDSLSVPPSIAVQEQELVASTSRDMHSHSHEPVLRREAYVSLRSLRRRKSSDSHLSTASESSFSDISISSTSDWEMLEGESIGQYLKVEDTATTT